MKQYFTIAVAWLLAALFISPAAFAGVIIQPIAASTNMGTSVGSPNNVINQSGLSVGYTSGITEYDEDSVGRHDSLDNNAIWASLGPMPPESGKPIRGQATILDRSHSGLGSHG